MKRFLGILVLGLLWCNQSFAENIDKPNLICTWPDDKSNIFEFDLSRQKMFIITKISNSVIVFNYDVGEIFVTADFNRDSGLLTIFAFNDAEKKDLYANKKANCKEEKVEPTESREVIESNADIVWKLDDKFIIPECFDYIWLTADNYEAFFDEYIEKVDVRHSSNPKFKIFATNIGNYLNKEVPLNHTVNRDNRGVPEISLTRQLEGCLSIKPETYIQVNGEYGSSTIEYRVMKSFDPKIGKELAPHISEKFESIKQVEIASWGGGTMGPKVHTVVFGIIELEGKKVLLPLRNKSIIKKEPKKEKVINIDKIYDWIKSQTKHTSANSLMWDDKFNDLLDKEISKKVINLGMGSSSLYENFYKVLGGPPNEIIYSKDRRYMFTSACRRSSCDEKGFVFIDTKKKLTIGLIRHFYFNKVREHNDGAYLILSKSHKSFEEVPKIFIEKVKAWSKKREINPKVVRFIGADDKIIEVTSKY